MVYLKVANLGIDTMHIVLALLGVIVTILILLKRLADSGIDLGGLNPFLWQRRRKWRNKFEGNPIYQLDSPMETTALLMTATAKADGDISAEQKRTILSLFQEEFNLSRRDASGLLISSSHLLGNGEEVRDNLEKVLTRSLKSFTEEQARSAVELLERVANAEGSVSELQRELVSRARAVIDQKYEITGKWS